MVRSWKFVPTWHELLPQAKIKDNLSLIMEDRHGNHVKLNCIFIVSNFPPSWREVQDNHKSTLSQLATKLHTGIECEMWAKLAHIFLKKGGEAEGCMFRTAAAGRGPWTKERR